MTTEAEGEVEKSPLDVETAIAALIQMFPDAKIDYYSAGRVFVVNIHSEMVRLRYADMPKFAEILGTERLDFCTEAGADKVDSVSYGTGVVLTIYAKGVSGGLRNDRCD